MRKLLVSFFSSNIPLYNGKNPVEKLCKILEMELKTYTPVSLKFVFEESNLKFCIIFNLIFFVNAEVSVKIRLACAKALLLTTSSSNIVTHSNGYIKGDKYFFFIKVSAANVLQKLFAKCSRDTMQKDHIYNTKKYQTFYRKIKCSLLNFRGVKNGCHQGFQYLMVSIHFFFS